MACRQSRPYADRAYDARALVEQLRSQRCRVLRPTPVQRRHRVENFFQRLKRSRRMGTRYDKLSTRFFTMVCLAAVLVCPAS